MVLRGRERIEKIYPLWALASLIGLYFFLQSPYNPVLLWIVGILIIKDIFIDIGTKRGSTPWWFEHAPFVMIIAFIGVLGLLEVKPFIGLISPLTTGLAIFDSFIDFFDDMGAFEDLL